MANFIMGIISLTVSIVILAGVLITTVKDTNTDSYTTSEATMFGLISLISIVGIVYGAMQVFGLG